MKFTKPVRLVERVFLHCSASDNSSLIGRKLLDEITRWHTLPKRKVGGGNGWSAVGYHHLFDKAGLMMIGRGIERMPAAQYPDNPRTIAIMIHGLEDFPTPMLGALTAFCVEINEAYEGRISFHGHLEVNPHKTCPVIPYRDLLGLDRFGRMP